MTFRAGTGSKSQDSKTPEMNFYVPYLQPPFKGEGLEAQRYADTPISLHVQTVTVQGSLAPKVKIQFL